MDLQYIDIDCSRIETLHTPHDMITKDHARQLIQSRLNNSLASDSKIILVHLVNLLATNKTILTVLGYSAVESWSEVDVSALPDLLPVLEFDFVSNMKNAPFPTKQYDAILVPLLGFTKDGYRLGRGAGWYDRFLTTQPQTLKIGVGQEATLLDFTPEPHDIAMDVIVTEKQTRLVESGK